MCITHLDIVSTKDVRDSWNPAATVTVFVLATVVYRPEIRLTVRDIIWSRSSRNMSEIICNKPYNTNVIQYTSLITWNTKQGHSQLLVDFQK